MKAIRIHQYGGPEVLTLDEVPRPAPGAGEVLVRVHAAGVNPVDWKVREGHLQRMIAYPLPLIPGWDVSGVVEDVGPGVSAFATFDEVYSRPDIRRDGAYAEYIVMRAEEVARKPSSLDHVHAAAIPLAGLTAWQGLFEAPPSYASIGLVAGQTVLIHGAAGGVGAFAVQLAKWKGARVIGTGSAKNEQFARDLGADEYVDYTQGPFEASVRGVDAVFDTIGGDTQARSWKTLKPGGVLLSVVSPPSQEAAKAHQARAAYLFIQPNAAHLAALATRVDAGDLRVVLAEVLPLAQARKAHELSQTGHTRGKIVLQVR